MDPPVQSGASTTQSAKPPAPKNTSRTTKKKTANKQKRSDREFLQGYRQAHALIYDARDYAAGIAALRALGRDDHADVANLVGFASRKLGRYDDAKHWYEKALAADPNHSRTWSYYGMWHAEQGNVLKAQDHLDKVRSLCGTGCRDYVELQAVISGTGTY
jgi:tetratricopeptide (TPR) repeat protein